MRTKTENFDLLILQILKDYFEGTGLTELRRARLAELCTKRLENSKRELSGGSFERSLCRLESSDAISRYDKGPKEKQVVMNLQKIRRFLELKERDRVYVQGKSKRITDIDFASSNWQEISSEMVEQELFEKQRRIRHLLPNASHPLIEQGDGLIAAALAEIASHGADRMYEISYATRNAIELGREHDDTSDSNFEAGSDKEILKILGTVARELSGIIGKPFDATIRFNGLGSYDEIGLMYGPGIFRHVFAPFFVKWAALSFGYQVSNSDAELVASAHYKLLSPEARKYFDLFYLKIKELGAVYHQLQI